MKVLISNLYECAVPDIIIHKRNPQKVYLITVKDKNKTESTVKRLKKDLPNIDFKAICSEHSSITVCCNQLEL